MQNLSERADSTRRLDKATTGYFESLSDVEFAEENSIAECLSRAAENIDIDSQTD
jgi:hypothetical protein